MTVKVEIGSVKVPRAEATLAWLAKHLAQEGRERPACVSVEVPTADGTIRLRSPACGPAGIHRSLTPRQRLIVSHWERQVCHGGHVTPDGVFKFLEELDNLLASGDE